MGNQTGRSIRCFNIPFPLSCCVHKLRLISITRVVNILFSELDARYCGVLAEGLCFTIHAVAYNVVIFRTVLSFYYVSKNGKDRLR